MFCESLKSDIILFVFGFVLLFGECICGMWNYVVWQFVGDELLYIVVGLIIDMIDFEYLQCWFVDYCLLFVFYGV